MAKLEGIIYSAFSGYVVLRGYAPIGELAELSRKPDSYQRNADNQHKIDIVKYLSELKSYFPEITLACRVKDYEGLIQSIGDDKDVSAEDSKYVKGLRVLSERVPIGRDRARHAYLELKKPTDKEKLIRVDGNHRLEPFSSDIEWWHQLVTNRDAIKDETDESKIKGWLDHQAKLKKDEIVTQIVPFTIIMSDGSDDKEADNFEARIFHDINFKALPLREEASLRIISDLQTFEDYEKMGIEYPLAMKLIKEIRNGMFNAIPWLRVESEIENSYFRTSCLRIVQLLFSQRKEVRKELQDTKNAIKDLEKELDDKKKEQEQLEQDIKTISEEIAKLEIENPEFEKMSNYKLSNRKFEDLKQRSNVLYNELDGLHQKEKHLSYKEKSLNEYHTKCSDKNSILSSLTALVNVYNELGDSYGNIAYLCALVHYSLLDKGQLDSFISWSKQNGINKITKPDDLSKDASLNLITMFNQIHQSKKNEIFISMQFGDSQSELIFEKIVRAIEKFNSLHKDINLSVKPIRIDRNVESNIYSIPDSIREAIKSCGLIIADLSSANINVYHEIGYAMGVAESHNRIPNIILLYKENTEHNKENKDIDKFIGFNLRNLSQLRFRNYDQLVDGLVERLEKHYEV